ncbi:hypothetical protein Ciccas_001964 [Cichlidogyrus casuarinus]|uniref:Exocyst subunit Exo70 family protein n=1 Tax=Cichlidogyrus casuarinus TaxID=1844966 RepID=A0ABD2QIK2_9PLAT
MAVIVLRNTCKAIATESKLLLEHLEGGFKLWNPAEITGYAASLLELFAKMKFAVEDISREISSNSATESSEWMWQELVTLCVSLSQSFQTYAVEMKNWPTASVLTDTCRTAINDFIFNFALLVEKTKAFIESELKSEIKALLQNKWLLKMKLASELSVKTTKDVIITRKFHKLLIIFNCYGDQAHSVLKSFEIGRANIIHHYGYEQEQTSAAKPFLQQITICHDLILANKQLQKELN